MIPSGIGPVIRLNDRSSSVRVAIWANAGLNPVRLFSERSMSFKRRGVARTPPCTAVKLFTERSRRLRNWRFADHPRHRPDRSGSPSDRSDARTASSPTTASDAGEAVRSQVEDLNGVEVGKVVGRSAESTGCCAGPARRREWSSRQSGWGWSRSAGSPTGRARSVSSDRPMLVGMLPLSSLEARSSVTRPVRFPIERRNRSNEIVARDHSESAPRRARSRGCLRCS